MAVDQERDILERLWAAAAKADPVDAPLLLEAAKTIETLRTLVGIREEIELEDEEPQGHA